MKKIYYGLAIIIVVIAITLSTVNYESTHDEQAVYSYGGEIRDADFETFEKIDNTYGKDKNSAYIWTKPIENSDPDTFIVLGNQYSKDKNSVYYFANKLDGVDLETFEIIPGDVTFHEVGGDNCEEYSTCYYGKDKNTVWYGNKQISNSDPSTFELFDDIDHIYSKDANNIYFKGERLEGMTPETFTYLGDGFARNNDVIYFYIDPDSGAMVTGYKLMVVEGADAETFELLSDFNAKDKNNFYHGETIIEEME